MNLFFIVTSMTLFSRLVEYNLNVDEQMNNGVASKYNAVMTDD